MCKCGKGYDVQSITGYDFQSIAGYDFYSSADTIFRAGRVCISTHYTSSLSIADTIFRAGQGMIFGIVAR